MSAHDEFCGCGEYSCSQCFDGDPSAKGNAWIDQDIIKQYPGTLVAMMARDRLAKYVNPIHAVPPEPSQ